MRKLRREIAAALAIIMLVSQTAVFAEAEEFPKGTTNSVEKTNICGDNARWKYADGVLTISGTGAMHDFNEAYYNEAPWIDFMDQINTVIIEKGITYIGERAFRGCSNLKSITISSNIGYRAFEDCKNLTNVTILNGVKTIEEYAFTNCENLRSITIPNSVEKIGKGAFYGCGITQIIIPDSVTEIESEVFSGCENLTRVTIPNSVTTIGIHAFLNCENLTSVSIPFSVTCIDWKAFGFCQEYNEEEESSEYTKASNFTIEGYKKSVAETYAKENDFEFTAKPQPTAKLNTATITLKMRQSTKGLKVTDFSKGDYIKSWKSTNSNIVKVFGKANGTCTIKAQSRIGNAAIIITFASGLKKVVKVKVQKFTVKTRKISGLQKKVIVKKGKSITLKPVRAPFTSQEKITYKTSNKKVATVNTAGKITGKKAGTAYVTVKSGKKSVKVKVVVK